MQKVWKTRIIAPLVAVLAIGAAVAGGFALAQTSDSSAENAAAPADTARSSSTAAVTQDATRAADIEELAELVSQFRSQGFAENSVQSFAFTRRGGAEGFPFSDSGFAFGGPEVEFIGPGFGSFGHGGFGGFGHGHEDEEGLSALGKYLVPESGDEIADALEPGLGRAVEDSAITQAEADELLAWIRSAPAALFDLPARLEEMFGEDADPDNALGGALGSEFEDLEYGSIDDDVAAILGVEVEALQRAVANAFFQGFRQRFNEQAEEEPNFLGGIAEELGVTEQALMDAYSQVAEQQQDAMIDAGLRAFVTAGVLTQEESNSIDGWIDDLPSLIEDEMNRGFGGFGLGALAFDGFGPGAFGGFDDFSGFGRGGHGGFRGGEFDFEDFDGFFDFPEDDDEDEEDEGDAEESGV